MTKQIIAIAITVIAIITVSGCAARPQVVETPAQVVVEAEEEVEIVNVTVYADSLEEAERQVANSGMQLQGRMQSVRQLASDSVRVSGWRQGAYIGQARTR